MLYPQQRARPAVPTAHVCIDPALVVLKRRPPATGVGVFRLVLVLSPREPNVFNPQQYAYPTAVTPQVGKSPTDVCTNVSLTLNALLRTGVPEPLRASRTKPLPGNANRTLSKVATPFIAVRVVVPRSASPVCVMNMDRVTAAPTTGLPN